MVDALAQYAEDQGDNHIHASIMCMEPIHKDMYVTSKFQPPGYADPNNKTQAEEDAREGYTIAYHAGRCTGRTERVQKGATTAK